MCFIICCNICRKAATLSQTLVQWYRLRLLCRKYGLDPLPLCFLRFQTRENINSPFHLIHKLAAVLPSSADCCKEIYECDIETIVCMYQMCSCYRVIIKQVIPETYFIVCTLLISLQQCKESPLWHLSFCFLQQKEKTVNIVFSAAVSPSAAHNPSLNFSSWCPGLARKAAQERDVGTHSVQFNQKQTTLASPLEGGTQRWQRGGKVTTGNATA